MSDFGQGVATLATIADVADGSIGDHLSLLPERVLVLSSGQSIADGVADADAAMAVLDTDFDLFKRHMRDATVLVRAQFDEGVPLGHLGPPSRLTDERGHVCEVGFTGPFPNDGTTVWALVQMLPSLPDQRLPRGSIVTFEPAPEPLFLPDYARSAVAADYAKSRLLRFTLAMVRLPELRGTSGEVEAALWSMHFPHDGSDATLCEDGESRARVHEYFASILAGSPALPEPRLVKTAAAAEVYAAEVMRALGFNDARATGGGADEGIDVVSTGAAAQVKMEGVATGRPVVSAIRRCRG